MKKLVLILSLIILVFAVNAQKDGNDTTHAVHLKFTGTISGDGSGLYNLPIYWDRTGGILSPTNAGDSLDVGSSEFILFNGEPFIHRGSGNDMLMGVGAGASLTTGNRATCFGDSAGAYITSAHDICAFGFKAGKSVTNTGTTAIGNYALYSGGNTAYSTAVGFYSAENTTGSSNTSLGAYSLQTNTSGDYSVAIGSYAMQNTTNGRNVAIGFKALQTAGVGQYNVAVGYQAGMNSNGGLYTVSIGSNAGRDNGGTGNIFIGNSAGLINTSGTDNVFIGDNAGIDNLTGANNTFVGDYAGTNSTGAGSVMIGANAGFNTTSGATSTYIGYLAGYTNSTSSFNTYIGYRAGYLATGGSNVFIGNDAGYNETGSDLLYIANDNTTTPLVYGDFSEGSFLINTKDNAGGTEAFNVTNITTGDLFYVLDNGDTYVSGMLTVDSGRVEDGTGVVFNIPKASRSNVYIGADCNVSNSASQTGNIGIGSSALNSVSLGDNNICIGQDAGTGITSGSRNILLGTNVGSLITSLSDNIFIGYNIATNGSPTGSVIMGYEAGRLHSTGQRNVIIGYQAGENNSGSKNNVIIGNEAGNLGDGNENVFVGNYAGRNASGHNNVMVGDSCGLTATGDSCVFLGHQAGYYETGSHKLMIDNEKFADEATARTSSLIYGEFDNNVVKFNADTGDITGIWRTGNPKFYASCGDSSTTVSITQDDTTHITGPVGDLLTVGRNTGIATFTFDRDSVTLPSIPGHYKVSLDISFSATGAGVYKFFFFVDGVALENKGHWTRSITAASLYGNAKCELSHEFSGGEDIKCMVVNTTTSSDIDIIDMNWSIEFDE